MTIPEDVFEVDWDAAARADCTGHWVDRSFSAEPGYETAIVPCHGQCIESSFGDRVRAISGLDDETLERLGGIGTEQQLPTRCRCGHDLTSHERILPGHAPCGECVCSGFRAPDDQLSSTNDVSNPVDISSSPETFLPLCKQTPESFHNEAPNESAVQQETCVGCGEPVRGTAGIGSDRYCHEGDSPTCYEKATTRSQEALREHSQAFLTKHVDAFNALATPDGAEAYPINGTLHDQAKYASGLDDATIQRLGGVGSGEELPVQAFGAEIVDLLAAWDKWQGSDADEDAYAYVCAAIEDLRSRTAQAIDREAS